MKTTLALAKKVKRVLEERKLLKFGHPLYHYRDDLYEAMDWCKAEAFPIDTIVILVTMRIIEKHRHEQPISL